MSSDEPVGTKRPAEDELEGRGPVPKTSPAPTPSPHVYQYPPIAPGQNQPYSENVAYPPPPQKLPPLNQDQLPVNQNLLYRPQSLPTNDHLTSGSQIVDVNRAGRGRRGGRGRGAPRDPRDVQGQFGHRGPGNDRPGDLQVMRFVRNTALNGQGRNQLDMGAVLNVHEQCRDLTRTRMNNRINVTDMYRSIWPCTTLLEKNACERAQECTRIHIFPVYLFWFTVAIIKFPERARGGNDRPMDNQYIPKQDQRLCLNWSLRGFLFQTVHNECRQGHCLDEIQLRGGAVPADEINRPLHSMYVLERHILRMYETASHDVKRYYWQAMADLGFTVQEIGQQPARAPPSSETASLIDSSDLPAIKAEPI